MDGRIERVAASPGFALQDELALMVNEGKLTQRKVLWSATIGPAQFSHLDKTLGTINRGMIADFVLLDANPIERIANAQRIHAVMHHGRYHSRAQLDAMLSSIRH